MNFMKPSEAMQLGSTIRPQAKGTFSHKGEDSCGIAAMAEAVGATLKNNKITFPDDLDKELMEYWGKILSKVAQCTLCSIKMPLGRLIPHMNDRHNYSRAEMSRMIEKLELDLEEQETAAIPKDEEKQWK